MGKKERKIDLLYNELELLNEKINSIKSSCNHEKYEIGNYSFRPGQVLLMRICSNCDDVLGEPSNQERIDYGKTHFYLNQPSISTRKLNL